MIKSFIKRTFLFLSPLFIYSGVVFIIDPFNVFHTSSGKKLTAIEDQLGPQINYPLYKLKSYENSPSDIILLGDSRVAKLKETYFEPTVSNLAYGGGTLPEIIESFWYIVKIHKPKKVFIGINFNLWNDRNRMNRVSSAKELIKYPHKYIFSRYTAKATYYVFLSFLKRKIIEIEKPKMSKQDFWSHQLEHSSALDYENFLFSKDYERALKNIALYCKKNNIELVIFIPPTHTDLQHKITDYDLLSQAVDFRKILSQFADIYDYDYPNTITQNNINFDDPYHFNDSIAKILAKELMENKYKYARFISKND